MPLSLPSIENMASSTDLVLLEQILDAQSGKEGVAVEFGPWLGALSVTLAQSFDLHVVDNFVWTKDHAKRVETDIKVGQDFSSLWHANMKQNAVAGVAHVADFSDFKWTGGPVEFVYIDGSKKPEDLTACILSVIDALTPAGLIVAKHVLDPRYPALLLAVAKLWADGVVQAALPNPHTSNSQICLKKASKKPALQGDLSDAALLVEFLKTTDLPSTHIGRSCPFFMSILSNDTTSEPLRLLAGLERSKSFRSQFEKCRPGLEKAGVPADRLRVLGDFFMVHHGGKEPGDEPIKFHGTHENMVQGYWLNNLENPDRLAAFHDPIMQRALDFGYISWPSKVRSVVVGQDVLDIGCGPGLHGLGYLAAGAKSYTGLDPIVKRDKDRVKNLTAKTKEGFGWSPIEIEDIIPDWKITPLPIEQLPNTRDYDLATLHNVTEHLHEIEMIFEETAKRLRKGGKMLYNHHNFYSWNGHHLPPKTTKAIDTSDPKQREMMDWGHVEYEPTPDHYIARGLNRISLDDIIALTEKFFVIEEAEEMPSRADTGKDRLTDEIRQRYPYLTDRDFLTQNLYCVARVK